MKKRAMALVCALLLMLSMSMSVFAAPSVSADKEDGTGSTTGTTSPITGEPITLALAGASIVIGAAGAVVSRKRK